jgi:hypothetical protein
MQLFVVLNVHYVSLWFDRSIVLIAESASALLYAELTAVAAVLAEPKLAIHSLLQLLPLLLLLSLLLPLLSSTVNLVLISLLLLLSAQQQSFSLV